MEDTIKDLTMLLIYLTEFSDGKTKRSWKNYPYNTLNNLTEEGYLFPSKYTSKSVTMTKNGEEYAKKLLGKYNIKESK